MKPFTKHTLRALLTLTVLFFALSFTAYANDEEAVEENEEPPAGVMMTITGRVNNDFQIVTPDGVYEIVVDGEGSELLEKAGRRVTVTGYITVEDGEFEEVGEEAEVSEEAEMEEEAEEEEGGEVGTISVLSYKVLAE